MTLAFERLSSYGCVTHCLAVLCCTARGRARTLPGRMTLMLLHFVLGCGYAGATLLNSEFAASEIHSEYCIRLRDVSSQGFRQ